MKTKTSLEEIEAKTSGAPIFVFSFRNEEILKIFFSGSSSFIFAFIELMKSKLEFSLNFISPSNLTNSRSIKVNQILLSKIPLTQNEHKSFETN